MSLSVAMAVLVFLVSVPWGTWVIRQLTQRGIGKHIRTDGPSSHQVKSGTPTMGGLYILAAVVVFTLLLALAGYTTGIWPLVAMLVFGLLGAFDDLQGLKDASGVGWLARAKFPVQWGVALIVALAVTLWGGDLVLIWPGSGVVWHLGWWALPITAFLLVAFSNAVNLHDGLDGLAGGTSAIAYGAYGLIAALAGQQGNAAFCFVVVGALLAFLWYNVHPARVIMGDTGSQALGAGLVVVAMLSGQWVLLPVIGIIYVVENLSVMVQVSYFKFTRLKYGEGRRIFKMAPLHHHFELAGWPEEQVTLRFWLVAAVAAALGVALATWGAA